MRSSCRQDPLEWGRGGFSRMSSSVVVTGSGSPSPTRRTTPTPSRPHRSRMVRVRLSRRRAGTAGVRIAIVIIGRDLKASWQRFTVPTPGSIQLCLPLPPDAATPLRRTLLVLSRSRMWMPSTRCAVAIVGVVARPPKLARPVPLALVGLCFNCLASSHVKAECHFPARCFYC